MSDLQGALMLFAQKVRLATLSEARGESAEALADYNVGVLAAAEQIESAVEATCADRMRPTTITLHYEAK